MLLFSQFLSFLSFSIFFLSFLSFMIFSKGGSEGTFSSPLLSLPSRLIFYLCLIPCHVRITYTSFSCLAFPPSLLCPPPMKWRSALCSNFLCRYIYPTSFSCYSVTLQPMSSLFSLDIIITSPIRRYKTKVASREILHIGLQQNNFPAVCLGFISSNWAVVIVMSGEKGAHWLEVQGKNEGLEVRDER